jgi:streptogramin lyase
MTRSTRHRTARPRRRCANRARPRLEGLEDRCLLSATITEFPIPSANASLWITGGPDGNLWFTEGIGDKIGEINPATHAITEFSIPTAHANPSGITAGPDGNLWFTEYGATQIGMINPTTHAITEFPIPTSYSSPYAIIAGPDGNLWFTETAGKIGEINPATHAITVFAATGADPEGITAGPDANLWFAEPLANKIGMINTATHAIAEFPVPTASSYPWRISLGPDGNLWFAEADANQIGIINPATHVITEFPIPTSASRPGGITAGPDGNLWFTEINAGKIGEINPASRAITEFPIPYTGSQPQLITAGPDGNLWFADRGTNAIGFVTLYTTNLVVTQEPPTSVIAGSGFGLTAEAEDNSGNLVTSFNGTVTVALASNPGGATVGGTLTVTASGGIATFSGLTLTKAASGYTLVVTSSGLGHGVTSAMTVTPALPMQLMITQQPPATVKVSSPFAVKASIEDMYGNVLTTASATVGVAFANNPTGATLGGTSSVTTSQGVASFTNLTINKIGSGYTLGLSSSGLTGATGNPINVTKNGHAATSLVAPSTATTPNPLLAPLVLDSPALWDGLGFKKRSRLV